jgi:hypothetical protein
LHLSGNRLECLPGKDLQINSFVWFDGPIAPCDTRVTLTAQFADYSEDSFKVSISGALFRCPLQGSKAGLEYFFDEKTIKLFGKAATASWASESCTSFVVYVGIGSSIQYGSFMGISGEIFEYFDRTKRVWIKSSGAVIQALKPEKFPEFHAKIAGTYSTSACGRIFLDGNGTNLLGYDLSSNLFSWSFFHENQEIFSSSVRGRSYIDVAVTEILKDVLPSKPQGSNLKLLAELEVENYMGMISAKDTFFVDIQNTLEYLTSLKFDSPSTWDPISENLFVKPLIDVSYCASNIFDGLIIKDHEFSWKVLTDLEATKYIDLNSRNLYFPQGMLEKSFTRKELRLVFQAKLYINASNAITLNGDLAITINEMKYNKFLLRDSDTGLALSHIYVSGDRKIRLDSGWQSVVEFDNILSYRWSLNCYGLYEFAEIQNCLHAWNIQSNTSICLSSTSDSLLPTTVELNLPKFEQTYQFMVNLEVEFQNQVFISSKKVVVSSKFLNGPKIIFPKKRIMTKNLENSAIITFFDYDDNLYFQILGRLNSRLVWNCSDIVLRRTIINGTSNVMELKKGILRAGVEYFCQVSEYNEISGQYGISSFLVKVSDALKSSQLKMFPLVGHACKTVFTFSLSGIQNEPISVTYSFGVQNEFGDEIIWISRRTSLNTVQSSLLPGRWTVIVLIESEDQTLSTFKSAEIIEAFSNNCDSSNVPLAFNSTNLDTRFSDSITDFTSKLDSFMLILSRLENSDRTICDEYIAFWWALEQELSKKMNYASFFEKDELLRYNLKSLDIFSILFTRCSTNFLNQVSYSLSIHNFVISTHENFVEKLMDKSYNLQNQSYVLIDNTILDSISTFHFSDFVIQLDVKANIDATLSAVIFKEYAASGAVFGQDYYKFLPDMFFGLKLYQELLFFGNITYTLKKFDSPYLICGILDSGKGIIDLCEKKISSDSTVLCVCPLKSGIFGLLLIDYLSNFNRSVLEGSYLASSLESELDVNNLLFLILFLCISLYSMFGVILHLIVACKTVIIRKRHASESLIIPLSECGFKLLVYLILLSCSISKLTLILLEGYQSFESYLLKHILNYSIYCAFLTLQSLMFMLWNYEINQEILKSPVKYMSSMRPVIAILTGVLLMITSGIVINWMIFGLSNQVETILSGASLAFGGLSIILVCVFLGMSVAILENVANQLKLMRKSGKRVGFQITDVQYDAFDAAYKVVSTGVIFSTLLLVLIAQQTVYIAVPKSMWPESANSIASPIFSCLEATLFLLMFKLTKFSSYWKLDEMFISFIQRLCFPSRRERISPRMLRV